jgi:hypothetical protein
MRLTLKQTFSTFLIIIFILIQLGCPDNEKNSTDFYQQRWPSLANSPWPIHHGNPQTTGYFDGDAAPNGEILWEFDSYGVYSCSPIIGADNTIYVITSWDTLGSGKLNFVLKAINPDGTLQWIFPLLVDTTLDVSNPFSVTPVLDNENNIYVGGTEGYIRKISSTGELIWDYYVGSSIYRNALTLDLEGNIIFIDNSGHIYSLSSNGILNWKVSNLAESYTGRFYLQVVFSPDGEFMYIAGNPNNLFCLDNLGNVEWVYETNKLTSPPVITDEGNIIITPHQLIEDSLHIAVQMLDNMGDLIWTFYEHDNYWNILRTPTIDLSGNIIFSNELINYSLNDIGQLNWKYEFNIHNNTDIVSDSEQNTFYASGHGYSPVDNVFFSLSKNGTLNWETLIPENYRAYFSPAIDINGVMYFVTDKWDTDENHYKSKLIAIY